MTPILPTEEDISFKTIENHSIVTTVAPNIEDGKTCMHSITTKMLLKDMRLNEDI